MEEILASIKRVINEDSRPDAGPRTARTRHDDPPELDDQPEDVLELDDPMGDDALMSEDRAAVSRQSLAALAAARAPGEFPAAVDDSPLETLVKDMLRPMLKQWLDEKLPEMVEEMVAREIARITGKRL